MKIGFIFLGLVLISGKTLAAGEPGATIQNCLDALKGMNQGGQASQCAPPVKLAQAMATSVLRFESPQACADVGRSAAYDYAFRRAFPDYASRPLPAGSIPVECVNEVMKKFWSRAKYGRCETNAGLCEKQCRDRKQECNSLCGKSKDSDGKKRAPAECLSLCERQVICPKKNTGCVVPDDTIKKPCMTEAYVRTIHQNFVDVADCLGVSQKALLPKLSNESGLHMNVHGSGSDIGLGQLTQIALKDANDPVDTEVRVSWNRFQGIVRDTQKPSCRRIQPALAKMEPSYSTRDCALIDPPESPLKNLFYAAVLSRRKAEVVDNHFNRMGPDTVAALEAGTALPSKREEIKKTLTLLGYNVGPGSAVILYKQYLKTIMENQGQAGLNNPQEILCRFDMETSRSRDFGKNCKGMKILPDKNVPCDSLKAPQVKELTFFDYAGVCRLAGAKGYLDRLYDEKREIDQKVRGGLCTDPNFLSVK